MADKIEDAPKKKGKKGKIVVMAIGGIVLIGGGIAGGMYAGGAMAGGHAAAEDKGPKLVPKDEQKRGGGGEGEEGKSEEVRGASGEGGDKYASNYYAMEKDFTSNLRDSVHFVQMGLAVSTAYDDTVIDNLKTNDIAIRSAILMTLGDTTEDQVFSSEGKKQLQKRLTDSINATLKQKEGFGGISNTYFTSFVVQ
ncbi:flagellar basal body-associated protein FliL [Sphingomonas sp.]|uniref:flagellar basal body-associated FliL family protein n=1 Tax=Sphingomonas sp. TaxID=28214 RepID=UPI0035BC3AD3